MLATDISCIYIYCAKQVNGPNDCLIADWGRAMFEWDEQKSEQTRRRRGFGFEVIENFDWDYAFCIEEQVVETETREKWIGPAGDRLFVTVMTERGDTTRVISVRRADQTEIAIWRKEFQDG